MRPGFIFIIIFISLNIFGQPDTLLLEDVSISVTPFEDRLNESTGSLTILLPSEDDGNSTINLAEQLNKAPGVFVASGTNTTNRLTIRGIGSRTPYSSNRVRAYFEEIPLTNGDGVSTLEDIDMNSISRIEIMKGPSSALYGSGLGGVVMLKASRPKKEGLSWNTGAGAESFGTFRTGAEIGYKQGYTALKAGVGMITSDGFRQNNNYDRQQLWLSGETGTLKDRFAFHLLAINLEAGIPSSLNRTDFTEDPSRAAGNWLNVNGYEKYAKILSGISWKHEINTSWEKHTILFLSWQNPYELRPFNILDDRSLSFGFREFIRYNGDWVDFQSGFELFNETYNWDIYETTGSDQGDQLLQNQESRRYGNVFLHLRLRPGSRLNLETSANLNILKYDLETLYNVNGEDQSGAYTYQPIFSPRFGMNYRMTESHSIHFSVGHGFSAPSVEETLLPEGQINTELKPETGWNIDAGIRGRFLNKAWYYDLTAYTIFMENMLVTERTAVDIFTGKNAGSARLSGIEFYNSIDFGNIVPGNNIDNSTTLSLNINSNRFSEFVDDGIDHSGNVLPGIPQSTLYLGHKAGFHDMVFLQVEMLSTGAQYMNDANSELYEGHTIFNLTGSLQLKILNKNTRIKILGGVKNLLDREYASMILVNAPSFGGSEPRYYYPGMPRYFFVGLRLGSL